MYIWFGIAGIVLAMFLGCLHGSPTTSRNTIGLISLRALLLLSVLGFQIVAAISADRHLSMAGFSFFAFIMTLVTYLFVYVGAAIVVIARKRKGALGPTQ
jgi:hypothetical protein